MCSGQNNICLCLFYLEDEWQSIVSAMNPKLLAMDTDPYAYSEYFIVLPNTYDVRQIESVFSMAEKWIFDQDTDQMRSKHVALPPNFLS